MARILHCTSSRTAPCGDCLTVGSERCGERRRRGDLCTTSVPEGLNKCIKINTDGTGAAFPKVKGFSRAGKKKSFGLQVN